MLVVVLGLAAVGAAAGSLALVSPSGASAGVLVYITGTGFNATASANAVTFIPSSGPSQSVAGSSIALVNPSIGLRRLGVTVPNGLAAGTVSIRVTNTATGEISAGKTLQILSLQLPDIQSAPPGTSHLAVRITGSPNCQFVPNGSRASFGPDITVESTTVESPTSVMAVITVPSTATLGPRPVGIITSTQTALLNAAFTVAAANRPPVASLGVSSYTGVSGQPVAFDASGSSDPDGDPLTYAWTFGDGATATVASTTHTYQTAGSFTVTLTVTDSGGASATQTTTAAISAANRPPVARAAASYAGTAGQPIAFDASGSSDPDGDPLTYAWDFGDGATATGQSPLHAYQTAGSFTVALTVTDNRGASATATGQAQIVAAQLGRGLITGRVFGDVDGLPLAAAVVTLIAVDANTGPFDQSTAQTDSLGRFVLSTPTGLASFTVAKGGWTSAARSVTVVDGKRVNPLDVRLTPLDSRASTVTSVLGGTAQNTAGDVRLSIGSAALTSDASLRLTRLLGQGLAAPLPNGWSPVSAVDISPSDLAFASPGQLTAASPSNLSGAASIELARWDPASRSWLAIAAAERSADGASLQAQITRTGQYAFVLADAGAGGPQAATAGQPLPAGVPATSSAAVTISPSPKILFANASAHSQVSVLATPAASMTSGTVFDLDVTETYALSGGTLFLTPTPRTLALYRFVPAGSTNAAAPLQAQVTATPSRSFGTRLQGGSIDLAARLPESTSAAYGALIPPDGGQFTAATGERLAIPPAASASDLPVALTTIAATDLPALIPSGLTFVGGVAADFHGMSLTSSATLSIPLPTQALGSAQVLVAHQTEAGGLTYLELVAVARPSAGALVTSTDALGDGSVVLPGIRSDGWYLFLQPAAAVGFVAGIATGADGSPLTGAVASDDTIGLVSITDAAGRFGLAALPGPATVTTTNAATGDRASFTTQVTASAGSSQGVSVGPTALTVTSIVPADGSAAVALTGSVRVAFSNLIDPSTISGVVTLAANGVPVGGSITLGVDGRSLVFRPAAPLASKTAYQVTVAGSLRDTNGRPLAAGATSHFTTVDLTPPPPPVAGVISASIPGSSGSSIVSGTQGAIDPDGLVVITNLRTGAVTTLTPNADGGFSGSVAALASDRLQIVFRSAAGVSTTVNTPAFTNPDGSVVVGSAGGHVNGPSGTFADIPGGALPDGTVVKVDVATPADFQIDPPQEYGFVGGVKLDLGGAVAQKDIHVGLPAPADAQPGDQVLVAMPVELPTGRAWTVIDRASLSGGSYVSQSPPFIGIALTGSYGYLRLNALNPLTGCVSYVSVTFNYTAGVDFVGGLPDFVYPSDVFENQVTLPMSCSKPMKLQVLDPNTGAEVREASYQASAVKDDIVMEPDVITDDTTLPSVLSINNPTGGTVDSLQVMFSKAMNVDSIKQNFVVQDSHGHQVAGAIDIDQFSSTVTFRPSLPFLLGERYSVLLYGIKDQAGNVLDSQPITFTPFTPQSLDLLKSATPIQNALSKCTDVSTCTTAVSDVATIGHTLFVANGLTSTTQSYMPGASALLAIDVTDPRNPTIIGSASGIDVPNPRALAVVEHASFIAQPAGVAFGGDLLLVESGGRVPVAGLLPTEINVYDVTACSVRPATGNCLANAHKGFKALSTVENAPPLAGVPPDPGEPLQIAVLHQTGTPGSSDKVVAYAAVAGIGLEAVDVTTTFNATTALPTRAPDGLYRGDYTDLAVLKNEVLAVGRNAAGTPLLSLFSGQLGHLIDMPPPAPLGLTALNGAARVAAASDVVFDVDGDGNVGTAEDQDNDSTRGADELFDLALVSSGPLYSGCPAAPPCGELYVVDLSSQTDLQHSGSPHFIDTIPLPGSPFSVQIDPVARVAYVEIRGLGLAVVDLNYLLPILRGQAVANGLRDANRDGQDDRVLRIISTGGGPAASGGPNDILMTRVLLDTTRGLAFVNGASTGIEILQVANKSTELSLDFGFDPPAGGHSFTEERTNLKNLIASTVAHIRQTYVGALDVLEQGSGSCFWRTPDASEEQLASDCKAFQPGRSDHDLELFVQQPFVQQVQDVVDGFLDGSAPPPELEKFGDLSMFVMPLEPLQNKELLNGTPLYRTGDTSGDLGMGRQTLLLLWILEGQWVPGYEGPSLTGLLEDLKNKPSADPIFPINPVTNRPCTADDAASGQCEPTGIPRLEGYEWARLQEYNLYKTGALLRVRGDCDGSDPIDVNDANVEALDSVNDPDKNFNSRSFLGSGCKDTIHGVAKAAIRAALARVVADTASNRLVLAIDPSGGTDDLGAYRRNACFDFGEPPFNLNTTATKGCESFEEYIATVAAKAARATPALFTQTQLNSVVRFWCAKVDCDATAATKIVSSDADADAFILEALSFINSVETASLPVYESTIANDIKPIGAIPYLDQGPAGPNGPTPGIAQICSGVLRNNPPNPIGQIVAQDLNLLPSTIDESTSRAVLRLCNVGIVDHKVNGDPNITPGPPLTGFQMDGSTFKDTKKSLGVKKYVAKALRVRARNAGFQTASTSIALFEGDGIDPKTYTQQKTVPVTLDAGTQREIAEEPDPDRPDKDRPLFPVLFGVGNPSIAPGNARAFAFVIDPDNDVPETNKKDNQAGAFYYVLDTTGTVQAPAPGGPLANAADTTADPLALPQSVLKFTFRVRSATGTTSYGGQDIVLSTYSDAERVYEVANIGSRAIDNVQVFQQDGNKVRLVTTFAELRPAGETNSTATFTDPQPFNATQPGIYALRAQARGVDHDGNTVGPENATVYVTASDKLNTFDVKLFDASPLDDITHPFTRTTTHLNSRGEEIPIRGAVTDGDDHEGGGRIRIEIARLTPDTPATVQLGDAELAGVTDGVGSLTTDASPTTHALTAAVMADSSGLAHLYYYPPSVFVRDGHRADDFNKKGRLAQVVVSQSGVGSTTRTIALRRPPVFLVHGLLGTRNQVDLLRVGWDDFQPLVPPSGVSVDASFPVSGFDGRFDVFAVGTPFPSAPLSKLTPDLQLQIKLALTDYLSDFAIGKIDVVAHDMGGLLIAKLAKNNPQIAAAIRKLITLDTPFEGSALAKKLVEIRDTNPIKDIDLKEDKVDPLDPPKDFLSSSPLKTKLDIKVDWCAAAVRGLGLTPGFYLHGALDDLVPGSSELAALGDPVVPTHRIALETTTSTLISIAPSTSVNAFWIGLGLMCGITPDADTVEWTKNIQNAKEIIQTLLDMKDALEEEGAKQLKGLLEVLDSTLDLAGDKLKDFIQKEGGPEAVFESANDRLVESKSQLGSVSQDDQSVTVVTANVDHLSVKASPLVPLSACVSGNDFVNAVTDVNGDGVFDVVCHVMHLLEADPSPSAPGPHVFKQ
jgi:PKD repeat protein